MIYEYKCGDCDQVHEVWAKMADPAPAHCPYCQSTKLEKVISATSFALKGSGWYTTDYKKATTPTPSGTGEKSDSSKPTKDLK